MEYTPGAVAPPKKEAARALALEMLGRTPQPTRGEIAVEAGVSEATVTRWAKEEGLSLPKGRRPTSEGTDRQQVIESLMDQGWSPTRIAGALKMTRQAAHKAVKAIKARRSS